jgi:hypothetical protein
MMALGVPVGAKMAFHDVASYPARPVSWMVGRSGSCGARVVPVVASAFSLPP